MYSLKSALYFLGEVLLQVAFWACVGLLWWFFGWHG